MTQRDRSNSPRVSSYAIASAPGWVQLHVMDVAGFRIFDGAVPEEELGQEVSVIAARFWRMELERSLRENPPDPPFPKLSNGAPNPEYEEWVRARGMA